MNPVLIPLKSAMKKILLSAMAEKVLGPFILKAARLTVRYIQQKDLWKNTDVDEKFCDFVIDVLDQIEANTFK